MINDDDIDDFLSHVGVKGMKWGRRKKHTESRKEYHTRTKQEFSKYNERKAHNIFTNASLAGDDVILTTKFAGDKHGSILTGKQFVDRVSKGEAFDVRLTDIQAFKTFPESKTFSRAAGYEPYQKSSRR